MLPEISPYRDPHLHHTPPGPVLLPAQESDTQLAPFDFASNVEVKQEVDIKVEEVAPFAAFHQPAGEPSSDTWTSDASDSEWSLPAQPEKLGTIKRRSSRFLDYADRKFSTVLEKGKHRKPLWRYFSATMPEVARFVQRQQNPILSFIDASLRGLGLFWGISSPLVGICQILAILISSYWATLLMFVGLCSATLFAQFVGAEKGSISVGLFGFNGAFVGLALAYFWPEWTWDTAIATMCLGALSSVLTMACGSLFVKRLGVSFFTIPALWCIWIWLLANRNMYRLPTSSILDVAIEVNATAPQPGDVSYSATINDVLLGSVMGISFWSFSTSYYSSIVVSIGLGLGSPIICVAAWLGSLLANFSAFALGFPAAKLLGGRYAIMGSFVSTSGVWFFYVTKVSISATIIASVVIVVFVEAVDIVFGDFPALGTPGIVFIYLWIFAAWSIEHLNVFPLSRVTVPEDHIRQDLLSKDALKKINPAAQSLLNRMLRSSNEQLVELVENKLLPIFLCSFAAYNERKQLKKLLDKNANPDSADFLGRTALHLAACKGHVKITEMLLNYGASPLVYDQHQNTPLDYAILYGHMQIAKLLWSHNASVARFNPMLCRRLFQAAASGDIETIRNFIYSGLDVNIVNFDGRTPLHIACAGGHTEIAELIALSVPCIFKDRFERTPIDDAKEKNLSSLCQTLEQKFSEPTLILPFDSKNKSPLMKKTRLLTPNVPHEPVLASFLRELCSSTSTELRQIILPRLVSLAAASGDVEALELIGESELYSFSTVDYDGQLAIHHAVAAGDMDAVELLISVGSPLLVVDIFGYTPCGIMLTAKKTSGKMFAILQKYGSRVVAPPTEQVNTLVSFAVAGNFQKLGLYLNAGFDINAQNYDGRTTLHIVSSMKGSDYKALAVAYLLEHGADPTILDNMGNVALSSPTPRVLPVMK